MTAILALEMGNMDDTVTATYDALKSITLEDSHMGILTGEELTLDQLVKVCLYTVPMMRQMLLQFTLQAHWTHLSI